MHKVEDSEGEAFSSEDPLHSIPGSAGADVKDSQTSLVIGQRLVNSTSHSRTEFVQRLLHVLSNAGFGQRTSQSLSLVEVSIIPSVEEPSRQAARVVLELVVTQDMVGGAGMLHGSCIAHLVDICTSLPTVALSCANGGNGSVGVSQNINIIYHAPAHLGDKLRLINTSVAVGQRAWSARVEIWDTMHRRLVATATQVKMEASASRL